MNLIGENSCCIRLSPVFYCKLCNIKVFFTGGYLKSDWASFCLILLQCELAELWGVVCHAKQQNPGSSEILEIPGLKVRNVGL